MLLLTTLTVCASKLMRLLSTYLTPQPPMPDSQMDIIKPCEIDVHSHKMRLTGLSCIHAHLFL